STFPRILCAARRPARCRGCARASVRPSSVFARWPCVRPEFVPKHRKSVLQVQYREYGFHASVIEHGARVVSCDRRNTRIFNEKLEKCKRRTTSFLSRRAARGYFNRGRV